MVILLATVILGLAKKADAQVYGSISFNTFYNELSPYGRWVDDLQYGKVWIADAPGFEPYYNNGQWVYTSYGWTWASDYAWGWAPFHYGRWTSLPLWGWAWVPGYEWAPAWVGWCQQGGYYGWAPLGPGMGLNFSYYSIPGNYWRFVPQQYIAGPGVRNHIVRADRKPNEFRNATVINNTQVNNNITYAAGPAREAVERITRQRIDTRPVAFNGTNEQTRVEPKQVSMYRPDLAPVNRAATNRPADLRRDDLPQNREPIENVPGKMAVKPLPNTVQAPVQQPVDQLAKEDNNRKVRPLPAPQQENQAAVREPVVTPLPNEQDSRRQQFKKDNELKTAPTTTQWQDELRLQRAREQQQKEQQMRAQQEQRQQALQQQHEQRQNELNQQRAQQQEVLRQQLVEDQRRQQQQAVQLQQDQRQNEIRQQQEQRIQQKMMQQQQRQNEIRQQQVREAPMRPQRQTPVNQRPRSGKPNEN